MNRRNISSKASGSRARNTRLNVFVAGDAMLQPQETAATSFSFERPKSAKSVAPLLRQHRSQRDDKDFEQFVQRVGRPRIGQTAENTANFCIGLPLRFGSPSRIHLAPGATSSLSPHAIPLPSGRVNESQRLARRRVEPEDARRVEARMLRLACSERNGRQAKNGRRQVEVEMRPSEANSTCVSGVDHLERALQRLPVADFHRPASCTSSARACIRSAAA